MDTERPLRSGGSPFISASGRRVSCGFSYVTILETTDGVWIGN
jgi:hypothetical protein